MRKKYFSFFIVLVSIFIITACSANSLTKDISQTLGIDLSAGTLSESKDSHGGFHGDGITYMEMTFSDEESENIVKALEKNDGWNKLPLSENLNIALYGKESQGRSIGPFVTDDDGRIVFPKVDNGYYFFMDRHSDSTDIKDDSDLLKRSSFNFTIALYDLDRQALYYCKLDT